MRHPFVINSSGKILKYSRHLMDIAMIKAAQQLMAQEDAFILKELDKIFDIEYKDDE